MEYLLHEALKMQLIPPDGEEKKMLRGIILLCDRAVNANEFLQHF